MLSPISVASVALGLCAVARGQSFVNNVADIPQGSPFNDSSTENVDFGDIDNDGDWDAVFADGGDFSDDQNRIWVNMGNLQGGTLGVFQDQTATRCPAINDRSRDVEFADIDNDGDLDVYVSNTSTGVPESNRWWINMGGEQGGTVGFYQDQTSTRWMGLGGAGSSVAPGQVLASGGFIDFSCDCDFGDMDNDGDVDLFHSSYGGIFGGEIPTRMFLNNGAGGFSEFNPSGFQLVGQQIQNGNPGIWCAGVQSHETTNSTGTQCDVAATPLGIEIGDVDGDLDIDMLHGARNEHPRLFQNRLAQNGGTLTFFRDVTGAVFPAGYAPGSGHYEQEMGDCDGDGDLDIYGLNWNANFGLEDITLTNNGSGVFGNMVTLADSDNDDNEGDFIDYDQDGDVDLFIAAFGGADRVYRNNNNGGAGFSFTHVTSYGPFGIALDADGADVDQDGDTDVFIAHDSGGADSFLENTSQTPDVTAPELFRLEQAPNRSVGPAPTAVRVQVYDNAPYYINWYDPVDLEVRIDGGAPFRIAMRSSMGQIFRGEIPGSIAGTICYRAIARDRYGNTAQTAELCYTSSGGPSTFCNASDGADLACPCSNPGNPESGCNNAGGTGGVRAQVTVQDPVKIRATITCSGYPPASSPTSILMRAGNKEASPVVFGDGLRCVGLTGLVRLAATTATGGVTSHTFSHGAGAGAFHYQAWYRSNGAFCNPEAFNLSNGQTLIW